jgi:REP element-mobilizing transposase RayT
MARAPRIQAPDATYHVNTVAVAEAAIVATDADRSLFVAIVAQTVTAFNWVCLSFCLMDNHYHLVVTTPEPDLAVGIQRLNGNYARLFNRRHGRKGHLFGARYHPELIESDGHLLATIRYVALNPVRAGMCARPEQWEWSSYPGLVGSARPRPFVANDVVLELFGGPIEGPARVRRFVDDAPGLAA